ncbi:hypothetical protein BLNAU_23746 [Blattamonas nauphoetae]|uniref:Protein kinase domain-containing protein n=1 Tax=Blattamonas nauphoetae TaxID=2049346 RepID=A0ABQ9WPD4_9EUKA|nr:hypothetical protein BLNAU_23746 [Blattamonas nauphoetae]
MFTPWQVLALVTVLISSHSLDNVLSLADFLVTDLLPLVDIDNNLDCAKARHSLFEISEEQNTRLHSERDGGDEICVIGSSLDISSVHFPIGSGPLFSFGMKNEERSDINLADIRINTMLSSSSLLNVTSKRTPLSENENRFGSLMQQEIVGCCVSQCSNHDSGTTMLDVNFGGDLHSLNTSFSSCIRESNAVESYSNKNYTKTQRFNYAAGSTTTSATFTLCTFKDMTAKVGNNLGGSAILIRSATSLSVSQCFFHVCNVSGVNDDGGAVFVWTPGTTTATLKIAKSSFTECKLITTTSNFGGVIFISDPKTVTVSDSFFEKGKALFDSAITIYETSTTVLSNCSFVDCIAEHRGTVSFYNSSVVSKLSNLCFRGCSSGDPSNQDMYFGALNLATVQSKTSFCDSTSGSPNVYFRATRTSDNTLIPQITSTPTIDTCKVTFSGATATVTVTTKEVIGGAMEILLEGCLVPRLVYVQFSVNGENSTIGTASVSSGASGILPSATYSLRSFALPGDVGSQLFSASSTLKDANTTTMTVTGVTLLEGLYSMLVQSDGLPINISLTRTDSTTLTGDAPLYPSSATGRLNWSTQYEIIKVEHEKTRITSVISRSLNGAKDEVTIVFSGFSLPSGTGSIFVKPSDGAALVEGIVKVSKESECLAVFKVGWEENSTHLSFGKAYVVQSASSGSVSIAVDSDISFIVPSPPVITSFSLPAECSFDSFSISVSGLNLPSLETFIITLSSSRSFEISFADGSTGTGTIKAGFPSEMQFNTTYSIVSVTKGGEHVLLNQTSLTTPLGPTLETVSTVLNASNKNNVIFTLTGSRMMTGSHTLSFVEQGQSTQINVSVSIDTATTGSGEEVVFRVSKLKYGTTYTISSLTSDTIHFALDGSLTFQTPDEPARVVGIWVELDSSGNTTSITVRGRQIVKGSYTVKLNSESGPSFEISFVDELSDERNSSVSSVSIFGESAVLSFRMTYTLFSVAPTSSPSASLMIDANPTSFVISEPARVISAFPVLSIDLQTVTVSLSRRAFLFASFAAQLQITSPTTSYPFTTTATRISNEELEMTLPILSGTPSLTFGDEITILSLTNGSSEIILDCSTFVIPQPPKVTSAECRFISSLNTTITIELNGTGLPLHTAFLMRLDSGDSFEITFTSTLTGSTAEMAIGWPDTLQYSTTYRIVSIRNEDTTQTIFVDDPVSFTTGPVPSAIVVFCDSSSSDSSRLCGTSERPCTSMDSAWKVGAMTGSLEVTFRIKLNTTLSNAVSCLARGMVVVEKGLPVEPTLRIPSSALMGEMGMIVVSSDGLFELRDVDVVIESTQPSFVFLFASNSTLIIKDGSFVGPSNSTPSTLNENDDDDADSSVCCWETGIMQLDNCSTRIDNTKFSNLQQGGINMKGGNLSIQTSAFSGNTPNPDLASTARRNIRCSEAGSVDIKTLNGGDGTKDHPSLWISTENCVLSGGDSKPQSPLFIPSLESGSKSLLNKSSKSFTVTICGDSLFPCDLSLEVFEMQKNKAEGKYQLIDLSNDSTISFTESTITLSLLQSTLNLEASLEWRGRLVFGNGARTNSSFVIQPNTVDRFAQSVKDNMKWWIPLVVGLAAAAVLFIFIVVCCRRRQSKKKKEEKLLNPQISEMDALPPEKIEIVEDWKSNLPHDSLLGAAQSEGHFSLADTSNDRQHSWISAQETKEMGQAESHVDGVVMLEGDAMQLKPVSRKDTLYNRLHTTPKIPLAKLQTAKQIAHALTELQRVSSQLPLLSCLSSHFVHFDSNGNVELRLTDGKEEKQGDLIKGAQDPPIQPQPLAPVPLHAHNHNHLSHVHWSELNTHTLTTQPSQERSQGEGFELLRWRAPEATQNVGEPAKEIDHGKAAVFSLGLILFEIESETVPLREMDAVNANRHLGTGNLPKMELIQNVGLDELITSCLSLDPSLRPNLDSIENKLDSVEFSNPANQKLTLC